MSKDVERMVNQLLGDEPRKWSDDEQEKWLDDEANEAYDEASYRDLKRRMKDDDDDYDYDGDNEEDDDKPAGWFKVLGIGNKVLFVLIAMVLTALLTVGLVGCHEGWWGTPPSEEVEDVGTNSTGKEETDKVDEFEGITDNNFISENSVSDNSILENSVPEDTTKPKSEKQLADASSKKQKPVKVTVKINSVKTVYGASPMNLSYEIEGNVKKDVLSKYIVLTRQAGTNVGKYPITGECTAPNLYDVTFISGEYIIIPREVTVKADDKESYVGETLKPLTYTIVSGSIVEGDKEVVELTTKPKADPNKAGTYDIVGECKNSNYNLTVRKGTYTVKTKSSTSDTKPIDVTVKISDKWSYYGDNIVTLDFSITKGDVKKSDLSKYITLKKSDGKKVGSYKITGTCNDTKRYNVTFENGNYTIKARKLSISVDNKESFVGEALAKLTYSVASGSVVAGDECIKLSTNADPNKVGTYEIEATCKNSNYNVTIANKGVYTVKEKPEKPAENVTIQIENKTSIYGDSIVELDFSVTSGNVTKAEIAPYINLSKEGDNNAGDHPITGTCSDSKKYNVTFINGTYTITKRSLSVKADDKLTYEGDALDNLTYTITSGSIVNGDTVVSLSCDATSSTIGDYTITVNCINSNYVIEGANGTYRVKAKAQPPKNDEEDEEDTSSGPKDEEEDVKPGKPTDSVPEESTSLTDESEEVKPNTPTL